VEADLGDMSIARNQGDPLAGAEIDIISGGFYGDVTGRLGYAFGQALIYGKGGYAFYYGHGDTTTGIPGFAVGRTGAFTGWSAGGGIEHKITSAWSVKAEYLHFDFGSENATLSGGGGGVFPFKNQLTADTVKLGVNYYFAFH
jgi:outer membrane immunogenic protein